jgi:hypothetical protein
MAAHRMFRQLCLLLGDLHIETIVIPPNRRKYDGRQITLFALLKHKTMPGQGRNGFDDKGSIPSHRLDTKEPDILVIEQTYHLVPTAFLLE